MSHRTLLHSLVLVTLGLGPLPAIAAGEAAPAAATEPQGTAQPVPEADTRFNLDEALQALQEAQAALEQAAVEQAGTDSEQDLARVREELGRAHRSLREASREVARAHRQLARVDRRHIERLHLLNLGDRAVIGVLLGEADQDGVRIVGVSPDGPAERAGLRQGDLLVSIRGVELTGQPGMRARRALFEVMDEVEEGEEVAVSVLRDGEKLDFTLTAERREPASWQSFLRLPAPPPPGAPAAPGTPHLAIDGIEFPEFDEEELARTIGAIEEQLEQFDYSLFGEDGETFEFNEDFRFDGEAMSPFGAHALHQANIWFGLPHTRGLELVSLNPALGKYFKAERGVLVIRAEDDNAYGLVAGDVIQSVGDSEVNNPADLLRALRDAEPGSAIELTVKRDKRERTLQATVPENRLGARGLLRHRPAPPPPPAPPPVER
jgi:C-terminal processing protease CtpA/Prc